MDTSNGTDRRSSGYVSPLFVQDRPRRDTTQRREHSRARNSTRDRQERGRERPEKKDALTTLLMGQVGVCLILLIGCCILKITGLPIYNETKEFYLAVTSPEEGEAAMVFGEGGVGSLRDGIQNFMAGFAQENDYRSGEEDSRSVEPVDPRETGLTLGAAGQGGWFPVSREDQERMQAPEGTTLSRVVLSAKPAYPAYGTLTCLYGYRYHPTSGEVDFHRGIDIAASLGKPIYAAYPGEVVEVGESDIYGLYVVVEHSNRVRTAYCHCSEIIAREGQVVRRGDRLALVGSTGISTGPHLHFEVTVDNIYVDPMWLFDEFDVL